MSRISAQSPAPSPSQLQTAEDVWTTGPILEAVNEVALNADSKTFVCVLFHLITPHSKFPMLALLRARLVLCVISSDCNPFPYVHFPVLVISSFSDLTVKTVNTH